MWARVVRNSQERSSYHHHHKLPVLGLPWYLYLPVPRPGALGGSQPPSPLEHEGSPDFTLCWRGRKGAPSVIRNCRKKVLPQAAQVAPIHPSLCWPGEAGRCSRAGTDCPRCSGVSGEQDTPRLGPHGSIPTPALARPHHIPLLGLALRRAMPGGLGEPGGKPSRF